MLCGKNFARRALLALCDIAGFCFMYSFITQCRFCDERSFSCGRQFAVLRCFLLMVLRRCKSIKYARLALAAFMAVWLSGLVFLFCCHQATDTADSCPLMRLGAHCDKAERERNAEKVSTKQSDSGIDCCAFIPAFFDKTRTVDTNLQVVAAPTNSIALEPTVVAVFPRPAAQTSYLTVIRPKNYTFLKNRTFRI